MHHNKENKIMYASLARFGYNIATKLKPKKVKKFLKPAFDKATKASLKGTKMGAGEAKLVSGIQGAASKGYQGYRKLYKSSLGTQRKRRMAGVASSGVIGYNLSSLLDSDD
tara:strand:- start:87 stop:419 length:333 start_codon:yes stop_codon:yes gene_type:complete